MCQDSDYAEMVLEHYRGQAEKHGDSMRCTMEDDFVRERELGLVMEFLSVLKTSHTGTGPLSVLDMGCGNGYALKRLSETYVKDEFVGGDFSKEMLEIARGRNLGNCRFAFCDARDTPFGDGSFDVVFTERCLVNILDWEAQLEALLEIARILKPDGHYLMIECFSDGLQNNNKARIECGMAALKPAYHNLYLEKERLFESIEHVFRVIRPEELDPKCGSSVCQTNFLSSHYFVARVLHPLVTKGEFVRNSEFVRFLSLVLPPIGNYSPIQAYLLARRSGPRS